MKKSTKGQSTLEYAAIIAVVVAAIVALNVYMKRGIEGHLRNASDDIGTQYDIETGGYKNVSQLGKGQKEIQYSAMGTKEGDINVSTGWTPPGVITEEGAEVQWNVAGQRTIDEASTTEGAATIGPNTPVQ